MAKQVNINANGNAVPKKRTAGPGEDVDFHVAGKSVVLCFAPGVFPNTRYEICRNTTRTLRVEDDADGSYKYRIDVCTGDGKDDGKDDCKDDCSQENPAPCNHIRPMGEEDPPEMIII